MYILSVSLKCDLFCVPLPLQHWESIQNHISSAHHPRDRGRSDRLLTRPGSVWALPQSRGAPLGGRSRTQRHWIVQPVSGAPAPFHRTGVGSTARLTLPFYNWHWHTRHYYKASTFCVPNGNISKINLYPSPTYHCTVFALRFFGGDSMPWMHPEESGCMFMHFRCVWMKDTVTRCIQTV